MSLDAGGVQKTTSLTSEAVVLKNWDVALGKIVRDLCRADINFDPETPIVFRCGDLVEWATERYVARLDEQSALAPSEYLNIEGARLARFLTGAGWTGPGYVLNCDAEIHAWTCAALAESAQGAVFGISVDAVGQSGESATFNVSLRAFI